MMHENILTFPENFLRAQLMVVAVRTKMIMDLRVLNEQEKNAAIDEMVERQLRHMRTYCGMD
jgi:hypothetical protein